MGLQGYVIYSARRQLMRVVSFGSGSSGNAFLVQSRDSSVLVDVGVPVRRLRQGLAAAGVDPSRLDAVLISHEHWDHVRALESVIPGLGCPVFATRGTARSLGGRVRHFERLVPDATRRIGALDVTALAVPHDAEEPAGFVIEDGDTRVSVFTDLGAPPPSLAGVVGRSDLVVIEANYDAAMLARGRYPEHLKRRIRGPLGHLSNDDCGAFLSSCLSSVTLDVWLAHLSENNNRPALALQTVQRYVVGSTTGPRLAPLPRRGQDVVWDSEVARSRPRQVGLPLG